MPTRNKEVYNRLNEELAHHPETTDYDLLLQIALQVLKFNDVYYDDVEFL